MDGIQKTAYLRTIEIAEKIKAGFYGEVDDFDDCSFFDDFEDIYEEIRK